MTLEETKLFAKAFIRDKKAMEIVLFTEPEKEIIMDFYRSVIDQCDYIERVSNPGPIPREILND